MESLRNVISWLGVVTLPMRAWKYGEDGKYIHIMLGIIGVALLVSVLTDVNLVGLSIFSWAFGIVIEMVQRQFGGQNTTVESAFDALWVWVGGTAFGSILYFCGIITLYYTS